MNMDMYRCVCVGAFVGVRVYCMCECVHGWQTLLPERETAEASMEDYTVKHALLTSSPFQPPFRNSYATFTSWFDVRSTAYATGNQVRHNLVNRVCTISGAE